MAEYSPQIFTARKMPPTFFVSFGFLEGEEEMGVEVLTLDADPI